MATGRGARADAPASGLGGALERYFQIRARGSSVGTEVRGGITTFIVMAYILVVNPVILSALTQGKGPDFVATATMTALAAGVVTIAMGLATNYPIGMASGMGLNAFVAFDLILGRGMSWQAAMGVVVLDGLIITALVLVGYREAVMLAIPLGLKRAISVGIGFFVLFIGLVNAGFVRVPVESIPIVNGVAAGHPQPPVTLGNLVGWPIFLAIFGLLLSALLLVRNVRGALIIGIVATTALGIVIHYATGVDISAAEGAQGALPSHLAPISFATFGAGLNLEVFQAVPLITVLLVVFSLIVSDFFDTMGTVVGLADEGGWLDEQGSIPGLRRILLIDGLGAVFGGLASASSVTAYVESAAGIAEGARTGLAAVVTGLLFLAAILLAPLVAIVPSESTAPALIVVGFLMAGSLREIDFSTLEEGLPALLTLTVMPFTFSISNGIGAGFVMWVFLKLARGKARTVNPLMSRVAAAFVVYFSLAFLKAAFGI
jgi:AGZA family xanthine/uracil permease-like MFS transporter